MRRTSRVTLTAMTTSPESSVGLHDAITTAALRDVHPRLRDWYDEPTLATNMRAHLAEGAEWVGDEEFGAAYRDGVAVIDVPDAVDWANRLLTLPCGGWAVTGIRFRGRDLTKPFVEIAAHDVGDASSGDHWHAMADEIARAYAPFAPGRLQVFTSSPDSARVSLEAFGFQTEVDTYLVAGLIRELRERPRSTRFDDVTLAPISASGASRLAERVHDDLAEQNPETRLWSTPQTLEEFDEHAAAGTLFGIHLADRLVGIIAAFRWNAHGMTGFTVAENVIDAPHRGQKLAPAAMQHLFEMLPAADGDVLWGTIHPDNTPSLHNALRVGREIVGAHLWLTPAGWPGW